MLQIKLPVNKCAYLKTGNTSNKVFIKKFNSNQCDLLAYLTATNVS